MKSSLRMSGLSLPRLDDAGARLILEAQAMGIQPFTAYAYRPAIRWGGRLSASRLTFNPQVGEYLGYDGIALRRAGQSGAVPSAGLPRPRPARFGARTGRRHGPPLARQRRGVRPPQGPRHHPRHDRRGVAAVRRVGTSWTRKNSSSAATIDGTPTLEVATSTTTPQPTAPSARSALHCYTFARQVLKRGNIPLLKRLNRSGIGLRHRPLADAVGRADIRRGHAA